MSSEITYYQIMNSYTGKVVVPRTPEETVSPLCEVDANDPNYKPQAFNWQFIEIGQDLYRLVNHQTSLCVQVKHGELPPEKDESVHQNTCVADSDDEKWYFRNGRFECFLNPTLVWEPRSQSKDPYTEIVVNTSDQSPAQSWIRTAIAAEEAAAKGAGE